MKTNRHIWIAVCFVLVAVFSSCRDQGDAISFLEIESIRPAPSSTMVDKAAVLNVTLNREVVFTESSKMKLRYLGDTTRLQIGSCEEPIYAYSSRYLSAGCGIWKPGRTVQVSLPKDITDIEGNTLRVDVLFSFTVAPDSVPFELVDTTPRANDTVSIPYGSLSLRLRFSDYTPLNPNLRVSVVPAAQVSQIASLPSNIGKTLHFRLTSLQVNARYEVHIPSSIRDTEGEELPHDYRLVFYTKP